MDAPAKATTGATPARPRPTLRGVSHAIAAVCVFPAVAWLYSTAPTRPAELGALVYGGSLVFLFTVSAIYHRVFWTDRALRSAVGRVDHSAIFVLIAGTYTPFCLLLGAPTGVYLLATVWASAAVGMAVVIFLPGTPKPIRSALYVLLGWLVVPFLPRLHASLGTHNFLLLVTGGAFYTVGAIIYAARRPDPFPTVFGFHEIFHLLVVAAAAFQFLAVADAIRVIGGLG